MSSLNYFILAGAFLAAYLIGSIPTGVLVTRLATGRDIRRQGSGNIGATNVRRVAGNRLGAVVLLGDVLKGCLPVLVVMGLTREDPAGSVYVALTGLGAFLGHLYPIYLKGRGGKGVATAAGCFLPISPLALAGAVLVFVLVVWRRRVVSLGSLGAAGVLPVFVWLRSGSAIFTAMGGVMAVLIFLRHSGNIRRLREGVEPRI
jgi:glycerol-3-phosphate acyltransferase PlsY